MPPPPFNWTTFLLGFAIALWIAIVLLFILPANDEPPVSCPVVGCGNCCGGGGGGTSTGDDTLWIPSGPEPYFCANNDNGGGVIQDNGGGFVQDNGGGVLQDGTPLIPAPTPHTLGEERGVQDFECATNDNGGGYIQDNLERSVVVPMEKGAEFWCWSNNGQATALIQMDANDFRIISYNIHHLRETVQVPIADPQPRVQSPAFAVGDDQFVYCTVPDPTDPTPPGDPWIVDSDNSCIAGTDASCP